MGILHALAKILPIEEELSASFEWLCSRPIASAFDEKLTVDSPNFLTISHTLVAGPERLCRSQRNDLDRQDHGGSD